MVLGEIGHPQANTQSKTKYTYLIHQFNSECFIDLNVKYKTIRLLESIKITGTLKSTHVKKGKKIGYRDKKNVEIHITDKGLVFLLTSKQQQQQKPSIP